MGKDRRKSRSRSRRRLLVSSHLIAMLSRGLTRDRNDDEEAAAGCYFLIMKILKRQADDLSPESKLQLLEAFLVLSLYFVHQWGASKG